MLPVTAVLLSASAIEAFWMIPVAIMQVANDIAEQSSLEQEILVNDLDTQKDQTRRNKYEPVITQIRPGYV